MQNQPPEKRFPFHLDLVLRRPLGRTLLLSMLALATLPALIAGGTIYHVTTQRLEAEMRQHLVATATLQQIRLQTLFDAPDAATSANPDELLPTPLFGRIRKVLEPGKSPANSARSYLVDTNGILLAGHAGQKLPLGLILPDTIQIRRWKISSAADLKAPPFDPPLIYTGPENRPVMGLFLPMRLQNKPLALFTEVDLPTALAVIHRLRTILITAVLLAALAGTAASVLLARRILAPINSLSRAVRQAAQGERTVHLPDTAANVVGELTRACEALLHQNLQLRDRYENEAGLLTHLRKLHRSLHDSPTIERLSFNSLELLYNILELQRCDFYLRDDKGRLTCTATVPGHLSDKAQKAIHFGISQADREKTMVAFFRDGVQGTEVPAADIGQANLLAIPLLTDQTVLGALLLEKSALFTPLDIRFLTAASRLVAVALNVVLSRQQEQALLHQTQEQAAKLKARETTLKANAEDMQQQTRAFQASEERLQLKQLELQAANAQMVKNAVDLESHMAILEQQNEALEKAHEQLAEKARQIEISSQYKTEFMANMSHELRTPLNSILLLSRLLLENKENRLDEKQFEFARTIYSAGEDLLNLINEILDLAKVESGKIELNLAPVTIKAIARTMRVSFTALAEQSGVTFDIHIDPKLPDQLVTDRKRTEQVVKNFLSNAFKFTNKGSVRLSFTHSDQLHDSDGSVQEGLAIGVKDSGIGIPETKLQMVFEAFQQVDGSTRRKYGGTGLGLSISRELARLLGGSITLESQIGKGSHFTLHLPLTPLPEMEPAILRSDAVRQASASRPAASAITGEKPAHPVPDDRNRLTPGEKCLLIIDASPATTDPIKEAAHEHGYKVLVAEQFATGLHLADYYQPAAVFLHLGLAAGDGWQMVRQVKTNPHNYQTPVFVITLDNVPPLLAARHQAAGQLCDPIETAALAATFDRLESLQSDSPRQVLVVAPEPEQTETITRAIPQPAIMVSTASSHEQALGILASETIDAVIVHPALASMGDELADALQDRTIPVFVAAETTATAGAASGPLPETLNMHTVTGGDDLLLALVCALHLPPDRLDEANRARLLALKDTQRGLAGRKILLADDDMRTVFAVSNALENQGVQVVTGKSGKQSLDRLKGLPQIDLILMDVMIGDVDGYQAIRDIRDMDRYTSLPIIVMTAKAMQGDRDKCLAAGADDYLAKPVNLDKLTSMLKVWVGLQEAR